MKLTFCPACQKYHFINEEETQCRLPRLSSQFDGRTAGKNSRPGSAKGKGANRSSEETNSRSAQDAARVKS